MKTTKGEGVGAHSLVRNTSRVERCTKAMGWGLGKLISKAIIHMDLHKLNNKLFSAQLEHLWYTDEPRIHKTHHDSDLGEATTFPLIVYFVLNHMTNTQMSLSRDS
jgi:hypothetical protein